VPPPAWKFRLVIGALTVMPTAVGIHVFADSTNKDVDGGPSPTMTQYHHWQVTHKGR
jgi:hypothetical protein